MTSTSNSYTATEIKILQKALNKAFTFTQRKRLSKKDKVFLFSLMDYFIYGMLDSHAENPELVVDMQQFEDDSLPCYNPNIDSMLFSLNKINDWYKEEPKWVDEFWENVKSNEYKLPYKEGQLNDLLDYLI